MAKTTRKQWQKRARQPIHSLAVGQTEVKSSNRETRYIASARVQRPPSRLDGQSTPDVVVPQVAGCAGLLLSGLQEATEHHLVPGRSVAQDSRPPKTPQRDRRVTPYNLRRFSHIGPGSEHGESSTAAKSATNNRVKHSTPGSSLGVGSGSGLPRLPGPVEPAAQNEHELSPPLQLLSSPSNLAQIAADASILLELFSNTKPDDDNGINDEQREMISGALEGVLKIHTVIRIVAARQNGSEAVMETEDTKVDAGCIICYTRVADTVLVPCGHLVLCIVCYGLAPHGDVC